MKRANQFLKLIAMVIYCSGAAAAQVAPCDASPSAFAELRERVLVPSADHTSIVAHRACFAAAPENTPAAILACWRLGVEVVEIDVQLTGDDALIVFHDGELSRMTDKWGYIRELNLDQIQEARLYERDSGGNAYGNAFLTNQKIPTLADIFESVRYRVMVNLEIKAASREEFIKIFTETVSLAREVGVLDHLLFKIPDIRHHGVSEQRHLLEDLPLTDDVQLYPMIWESEVPIAARLPYFHKYQPVGFEIPFWTQSYFESVQNIGLLSNSPVMAVAVQPFWSGGLDDSLSMQDPNAGWGRLVELGADHIMTDRPEALLDFLTASGRRAPRECGSVVAPQ